MEKFKISNTSDVFAAVIMVLSVGLAVLVGMAINNNSDMLEANGGMLGLLIIFLGVVAGVLILKGRNAEVEYDGSTIKLKSFFGKKEIDLSKVKTVSYEFVKGYGRGAFDTICLTLQYFETSGDSGNEEKLHNEITGEETDKMIKGDFSDYPLLQMYEDIIARYPEKKSIEPKPE